MNIPALELILTVPKMCPQDPCTEQRLVEGQRATNCQQRENNGLKTLDVVNGGLPILSTDTSDPWRCLWSCPQSTSLSPDPILTQPEP